ncbi:hypothetical protein COV53_07280 [Candidatus Gottesmanbacteria bacterium CG11_big_fil_rev_8_21_14_0_20_37_11]|uniref:Metallo-beta-lactamase domain-containing protein n=3 Tax=Candidatus Gottesmaniibacteriota TaxID=1752720 RepID=A0A2M7RQM8_9BACT|nr:MAG: hypothetical protein AUJ73_04705 [Candidatus Gottesmanbacteria bacterium CG1_02_37_22]PIP32109.1 MAG: hypothetical protein COX23_06470 [Candidatus Gottesmanbacteria bacterium CG23_combo_of_CG06-09_8_20_14_all_37_19]PIR07635.1 MAG: hypothetical protein COV53_07280 [Candidatus Gottesmanbacteria bacterium CG11_big_fil_rev_8_21_14_0_20_37_11]PIZ02608.1 MAG: hypothetical protein COY59_03875 [Candidatus Gottesmanbacteria bacterium CG_4_10_14_0_8_um_filter_37_24]
MLSKKYFIIGAVFGLVLFFSFLFSLPDENLHIVFCDVGQGDAVYIRAPSNQDMLIDGGPNDKVLACLGKHMPFYDRTIDVVMLTHPQKDHLQGLISVVSRYKVKHFILGDEANSTNGYSDLLTNIRNKNIEVKHLYKGDGFNFQNTTFSVLWPDRNWVAKQLGNGKYLSYDQFVYQNPESRVLGAEVYSNVNDFSYYLLLKYGSFTSLFTGDGDIRIQSEIMEGSHLPVVNLVKIPHHGARTAILPDLLDVIRPKTAVISVGKNSYGHPAKETIDMLVNRSIQFFRTDERGDIEVVSDGQKWWVK